MGDMAETFNAMRDATKQHRAAMLAKADTTGWVKHTSGTGYYDQGGNAVEAEFNPMLHTKYVDMRGNPHVPKGALYENKRTLLLGEIDA